MTAMTPAERADREARRQARRRAHLAEIERQHEQLTEQIALHEWRMDILQWIRSRTFPRGDQHTRLQ
jgi:hypothetical protein